MVVVVVRSLKPSERDDSIFNPQYKKEKEFIREENKDMVKKIVLSLAIILFLGRKYFESKVIGVEIYDIHLKKIDSCIINNMTNYYIKNNSPYDLILTIKSEYDYNTSYNSEVLYKDTSIFIWFTSKLEQSLEITGERYD